MAPKKTQILGFKVKKTQNVFPDNLKTAQALLTKFETHDRHKETFNFSRLKNFKTVRSVRIFV